MKNTFLNVSRKLFHRISLMTTTRFQYFENYHRRILTVQTCSISKSVYTVSTDNNINNNNSGSWA